VGRRQQARLEMLKRIGAWFDPNDRDRKVLDSLIKTNHVARVNIYGCSIYMNLLARAWT